MDGGWVELGDDAVAIFRRGWGSLMGEVVCVLGVPVACVLMGWAIRVGSSREGG